MHTRWATAKFIKYVHSAHRINPLVSIIIHLYLLCVKHHARQYERPIKAKDLGCALTILTDWLGKWGFIKLPFVKWHPGCQMVSCHSTRDHEGD